MDEYGITLRPQGVEDVHKIVDIEIVLLSLLVVVSLTSVVRANCGGPISTITLQNISSSENTHNIDIISQFIADLRLGDPLEAGEEFLQYVFDRLEVRLWCEPARTGLAVTIERSL